MKFTFPWLKEHLDTDASVGEIVEQLTSLGIEVDSVQGRGADLAAFVVAELTNVRQHPDAERLNLCEVDTGKERFEVVCGAPNVHVGMKAVFACVGTVIPESGQALKRAKIRGIESNGMLCSARELQLGEDHDGIIELPSDAPVGRPASEVLALEGPVIDIDITPNRSDCFGVVGIARELAAAELGQLRSRDTSPVPSQFDSTLKISFDFPKDETAACPLFVAREFHGVKNGTEPGLAAGAADGDWPSSHLYAGGISPTSSPTTLAGRCMFSMRISLQVDI